MPERKIVYFQDSFFHDDTQFVSHETGSSKHFLLYIVSNCKRLHQMIHSFENKHDLRILSGGVTNRKSDASILSSEKIRAFFVDTE